MPRSHRLRAASCTVIVLPSRTIDPGRRRLDAEERKPDVGASGADQPGKAEDLAAVQVEVDVLEDALAGEAAHREQQLALRRRRARLEAGPSRGRPCRRWRCCGVASARGRVEISRPSRKTVTWSAISKTSSMRWLTKRMATPWSRRSRTSLKSWPTSWAESEAVGSSMMRTRTLSEIALAISTDCCAASVSPRAGLRTSMRHAEFGEDRLGLAEHAAPVDELRRGPGG